MRPGCHSMKSNGMRKRNDDDDDEEGEDEGGSIVDSLASPFLVILIQVKVPSSWINNWQFSSKLAFLGCCSSIVPTCKWFAITHFSLLSVPYDLNSCFPATQNSELRIVKLGDGESENTQWTINSLRQWGRKQEDGEWRMMAILDETIYFLMTPGQLLQFNQEWAVTRITINVDSTWLPVSIDAPLLLLRKHDSKDEDVTGCRML